MVQPERNVLVVPSAEQVDFRVVQAFHREAVPPKFQASSTVVLDNSTPSLGQSFQEVEQTLSLKQARRRPSNRGM